MNKRKQRDSFINRLTEFSFTQTKSDSLFKVTNEKISE